MEKVKQLVSGYFGMLVCAYVCLASLGTLGVLYAKRSWIYHWAWPGKLTVFQEDMLITQVIAILGAGAITYLVKCINDEIL